MKTDVYYSNSLGCWVRLERQEDGEYCHTSGFATKDQALNKNIVPYKVADLPNFLKECEDEGSRQW